MKKFRGARLRVVFLFVALMSTVSFLTFQYSYRQRAYKELSWRSDVLNTTNSTSTLHQTSWRYVINEQALCDTGGRKSKQIDLLLLIPSSSVDVRSRQAVRSSYASASQNNTARMRHVFFFGISMNKTLNQNLKDEHNIYHDLVQIDAVDSYDNLTLKVIAALRWSSTYCENAKYVMKLDTDTWLNVKKLFSLFDAKSFSLLNQVGGSLQEGARPIRNPKHKWYTSPAAYPNNVFPPYCSGAGYIMTSLVAKEIANISTTITYLRMEDVYIGMCAEAVKRKMKQINGFHYHRVTADPCQLNKLITSHNMEPKELMAAWNAHC